MGWLTNWYLVVGSLDFFGTPSMGDLEVFQGFWSAEGYT